MTIFLFLLLGANESDASNLMKGTDFNQRLGNGDTSAFLAMNERLPKKKRSKHNRVWAMKMCK